MGLFHFIAVTPVDVAANETPRVQYADFILSSETQQEAFDRIRNDTQVVEACEVWGAPMEDLNLSPQTKLQQECTTELHHQWVQIQDAYTVVQRGKESLEQWAARRFEERCAQRDRRGP